MRAIPMVLTATSNPYLVAIDSRGDLCVLDRTRSRRSSGGHSGPCAARVGRGGRDYHGNRDRGYALRRHAPFIIRIPMPYDVGLTTLSLLVAIIAIGVAF